MDLKCVNKTDASNEKVIHDIMIAVEQALSKASAPTMEQLLPKPTLKRSFDVMMEDMNHNE